MRDAAEFGRLAGKELAESGWRPGREVVAYGKLGAEREFRTAGDRRLYRSAFEDAWNAQYRGLTKRLW